MTRCIAQNTFPKEEQTKGCSSCLTASVLRVQGHHAPAGFKGKALALGEHPQFDTSVNLHRVLYSFSKSISTTTTASIGFISTKPPFFNFLTREGNRKIAKKKHGAHPQTPKYFQTLQCHFSITRVFLKCFLRHRNAPTSSYKAHRGI